MRTLPSRRCSAALSLVPLADLCNVKPSSSYDPSFDTGNPFYRWGDYSHTSVDPCDQQTFWTIQEYVDSPNSWGVQVGRIPAPSAGDTFVDEPGVRRRRASLRPTRRSPRNLLLRLGLLGSRVWVAIAAAVDAGVTVNSITYTDPTHVTLNVSTTGATADLHTVTITNPDGQTASAAVLVVSKASPTISTALSASTITLGAGIHDTAALTGATVGRGRHRHLQRLLGHDLFGMSALHRPGDGHERSRPERFQAPSRRRPPARTPGRRSTAVTPTTTAPRASAAPSS